MPYEYVFNFELRHLVSFHAVARQLHFRRAAEALSLAQPALSRQIQHLETGLGARLFDRTRRRVSLTPCGHTLFRQITPILEELKAIPPLIHEIATGRSGHLRIAFTGLAMGTVLPAILRAFAQKHPGVKVTLRESPSARQQEALLTGEIDCGFFHPADAGIDGVETKLLLRERNGLVLPADHPLASRKVLRLSDLKSTPLVLFPRSLNAGFYDRILAAFEKAGVVPEISEEVWPRSNGVGLVRAGLGVTLMCPSESLQLPSDVVFRPLTGPTPTSRLVLGWHRPSVLVDALLSTAPSSSP